jgi:antitoxin component YwqK of YwqJK toxin-antitoxin module
MTDSSTPSPQSAPPRHRWWRFFYQFSLRTLLIVTTLAAIGCWWFLQPQTREERIAANQLKLRRQVRIVKVAKAVRFAPDLPVTEHLHVANVGRWSLRDKYDDLLASGRYENDRSHGKWTTYHINGRKAAEGEVIHGARNGQWQTWDEEGRLVSEVTYSAVKQKPAQGDAPAGTGGTVLVGMKLDTPVPVPPLYRSDRHGPARQWHASGQLKYDGSYKNDRREGRWTYYDERGSVTASGQFKDDKREGLWKELDPINNQDRQVEYIAGRTRADHDKLMAHLKEQLNSGNLRRQSQAAATLKKLGPEATPLLLECLDHPSETVKLIAARVFEHWPAIPPEALAKLPPLAQSADTADDVDN